VIVSIAITVDLKFFIKYLSVFLIVLFILLNIKENILIKTEKRKKAGAFDCPGLRLSLLFI